MSDEHPFSKAWHAWLKSEEARQCLVGTATGIYLENRLFRAFSAGHKAATEPTGSALQNHPDRGDDK